MFDPIIDHLDEIQAAASASDDLAIVSGISDAVNTVAGMGEDIAAVAGVADAIAALGPAVGDVSVAAQHIEEIQAAPSAASTATAGASLSMAWAEGHEPGGTGTKSAKEHAEDAANSAEAAETFDPDLYVLKDSIGTAAAQDVTYFATAEQGGLASSAVQPGDLADVATSGSYVDLTDKPAIGNVTGPSSATDGNLAVFDGTTGKLVKDAGKAVADLMLKDFSNATGTVADARLPTRLGTTTKTVTDWNSAIENGWYQGGNGAANNPNGASGLTGTFVAFVEAYSASWAVQTGFYLAGNSTDTQMFRRELDNGTWSAWYRIRISEAEQQALWDARYSQPGWKQIATIAASGTAVTFGSIPQTYGDLLCVFDGVIHDGAGSRSISMFLSSDGSSFSPVAPLSATINAATSIVGEVLVAGYRNKAPLLIGGVGAAGSPPANANAAGIVRTLSMPGATTTLQFTLNSSGNFTAGTFTLFGR
jgi:hypothetical protein